MATIFEYKIDILEDKHEQRLNTRGAEGWELDHTMLKGTAVFLVWRRQIEAPPVTGLPVNTSPPSIPATAIVGATINCSPGTWTGGTLQMAFKWKRAGTTISGETLPSYVVKGPDAGKQLTCECTATNSTGSGMAASNSCAVT